MPTRLLIQPIEETDAMNPHQITTSAPADDSRLLSLFRDWLALYRTAEGIPNTAEGDDEFNAARVRLDAIATEAIAKVPAAGAAGIAIKAVLHFQIERPTLGSLDESLLSDAALLVPGLAPLVADILAPTSSHRLTVGRAQERMA